MLQVAGVSADVMVEGDEDGVGPFNGRVIAIAVDAVAGSPPGPSTTWLMVVDDRRADPVWVSQAAISGQRLGR
jgi:hypothetical protein